MPSPDHPTSNSHTEVAIAPALLWDVFCQVIDNFGDIGVCWRLCADLAQRGHSVRLWTDDSSALDWMAPGARQGHWPRITVREWGLSANHALLATLAPADIWIEGFGCTIASEFIDFRAGSTDTAYPRTARPPVWINLEYLSAEDYVVRCHALPSPVMQGRAKGWTKYFYYPGFTEGTGGLLREPSLEAWQRGLLPDTRREWLRKVGVEWAGERVVSLFCYDPAALESVLAAWMQAESPTLLLVTPGRAARAVATAMPLAHAPAGRTQRAGHVRFHFLDPLPHPDFDPLLYYCDLNLVRGEDSLVRALWAGQPFIWQIYPQEDGAHAGKLAAFLDCMDADDGLRRVHAAWNGLPYSPQTEDTDTLTDWAQLPLENWRCQVQQWRARLQAQPDLVTALVGFVMKRR